MQTIGATYDEDFGNPPAPECLTRWRRDEPFVLSTDEALPWTTPVDGAADSFVLPIIWLEGLLRSMPVDDPSLLDDPVNGCLCFLPSCIALLTITA